MRGPCGPRKTLPGAPAAFFGTPEPTVYLIVHNTGPLSQSTLFFPSGTVMALKPWHNALLALGSMRTPQSISCDSIIMEWWLEFPNPQTLWALLQSVHENISWWISIDKNISVICNANMYYAYIILKIAIFLLKLDTLPSTRQHNAYILSIGSI